MKFQFVLLFASCKLCGRIDLGSEQKIEDLMCIDFEEKYGVEWEKRVYILVSNSFD